MHGRGQSWLRRLGLERPEARAWALYDWANSAVYTTVVGALFPVYFLHVVAADLDAKDATAAFGWVTTGAGLLVALCAPVLGALADVRASRKRLLALFLVLGALACAGLFLVERGDVLSGLVLFGLTSV